MKKHEDRSDLMEEERRRPKRHGPELGLVHEALIDPYSVLKPHELSVRLDETEELGYHRETIAGKMGNLRLAYFYVDWSQNNWISPVKRDKKRDEWTFTVREEDMQFLIKRLTVAIRLLSSRLRER